MSQRQLPWDDRRIRDRLGSEYDSGIKNNEDSDDAVEMDPHQHESNKDKVINSNPSSGSKKSD